MTDRFGPEGDNEIAKTLMCQPYMAHHVYCTAFLGLAFMPENVDPKKRLELLEIVIYPRGRNHSPLSQALFERMIDQFGVTCDRMGLPQYEKKVAVTQLNSFHSACAKKTTKVDGVNAPHLLCRGKAATPSTSKKVKKESSSKPKKIKILLLKIVMILPMTLRVCQILLHNLSRREVDEQVVVVG